MTTALQLQLLVLFTVFFSVMGRSRPAVADPDYNYCDRDYSCIDCTTVRVCAPTPDGKNLYETSRFTCGSSYPYCNYISGSCSSTIYPSCKNPIISHNFTCMRDGYFPDPFNCSIYYNCINETAYQNICTSPNSYYHPGYQYCVTSRYYCTDYTTSSYCSGYRSYVGRKIGISYTNNYFLECGYNYTVAAVDRCIGAYYFDSVSQMCLFVCPSEGLFLNKDNCTHYYKCSRASHEPGSALVMTDMICPEGQGFLESEYMCVNKTLVPNCYDQYPDLFSK